MRRLLAVMLLVWPVLGGGQEPGRAVLLEVNGVIGPAISDYLKRGLVRAQEEGAELAIVYMDTPGGLDSAMRDIIQRIISSPLPVVTYIAPSGARAASAGTYILYASHVAAMSPGTNLGAATPVQLGGTPAPGGGEPTPPGDGSEGGAGNDSGQGEPDAMKKKVVNDAVAYIRSLAQMRGRNADWAEKAVREAATLTAEEARDNNVIEIVAEDVPALLAALDGRTVNVAGQERTLQTKALDVNRQPPDWRTKLLAILTNPNVAYILMLIGIYGLIYEFANPGMLLPGVIGAICLLVALFAFQVLPINYAGLALILLGMAFMVAEAVVPSFGVLGIGGVIAFVIGSVILLDTGVPGYGIDWTVIAAFTLISAAVLILVLGLVLRAHQRPVVSGQEEMVGILGKALDDFEDSGWVRAHGEVWQARTRTPVRRGESVRVVALDGLTLIVEPQDREEG